MFCDPQVTPILYALRVALPAVALCICRQLEIVSSTLDVSYDPRNKYFTSVFHYVMCLVIPVVYAILRRFAVDWFSENRSLNPFRFRCARSQIRHRAGIWVSSGHLSIGPGLVFNLVHPPHPLYDHHLLRRPFVLQLPPSLLVFQPTPQPPIEDDHRDVLPLRRVLPLRHPIRRLCDNLRYGFSDWRVWTSGVHLMVSHSPG